MAHSSEHMIKIRWFFYLAGNASVTDFIPIEREATNWFRFIFRFRRFWHNEKFSELTLI